MANELAKAIEGRDCRGCGSSRGASCIAPHKRTVYVVINPEETWFCYERVFDYFESLRRPCPVVPFGD